MTLFIALRWSLSTNGNDTLKHTYRDHVMYLFLYYHHSIEFYHLSSPRLFKSTKIYIDIYIYLYAGKVWHMLCQAEEHSNTTYTRFDSQKSNLKIN